MAFVKPESMDFSGEKFSAIIYGSPGIGKTTLALSAPKPVLIDFDHGVSRVKAEHRKDTIVCKDYDEVWRDVNSPEMAQYETVIIDTGGSFVTYLKDWAMRTKGAKQKNGEFNSLKGFGYVKSEFNRFTDHVKTVLNKNIIYVFHSQEQADKDGNPQQRLMCEGSVRNTVWNGCDFGGYVQMIGDVRTICFNQEQEYFAKATHGITGRVPIPQLKPGEPNDFMTRLFEKAKANIIAENDVYRPLREQYDKAMAEGQAIIDNVVNAETANAAMQPFKEIKHSMTSEKELSNAFIAKVKALGLAWDKEQKQYTEASK